MAEYIKQEMSKLNGNDEGKIFYRMKTLGNIDTQKLVSDLAIPGSGLSEGSVMHVLVQLGEQLSRYLGEGYSVTLDGIGTFKASLGVVEGKEAETVEGDGAKRNAQSLRIDGVNYRASSTLIREANMHCSLKQAGTSRIQYSPYSEDERLQRALDYLETHPFLRITDYMQLVRLGRTAASLELKRFAALPDSGIGIEGRGSHRIYVKRKK